MTEEQIHQLFHLMSNVTRNARDNIRSLYLARLGSSIIDYCIDHYKKEDKADVRGDYVRFVIQYARTEPKAIDLARLALNDKSKKVRKYALSVIAYSLNSEHVDFLRSLHDKLKGNEEDLSNAIIAISKKNHNLFYPKYDVWTVSQSDENRHMNKVQFTSDVKLYIETYARDVVPELKKILGSLYE